MKQIQANDEYFDKEFDDSISERPWAETSSEIEWTRFGKPRVITPTPKSTVFLDK